VNRRTFLCGLTLGTVAAPLAVRAQQTAKVPRIGVLGVKATDPVEVRRLETFRQGLRELGWIEGKNIALEYRWTEGDSGRLPHLAADLVRLNVDLILARSSIFVQPVKDATSSIPIVFVLHADPVGLGHVASLARPGGNITGLAILQTELGPKQLQLLSTVVPDAKRIAVVWDPNTPSHTPGLKALQEAARALRVQLQAVGVRTVAELEGAFSVTARARAQAMLVLASADFTVERYRLAGLAMKYRLPAMFGARDHAEAGGLMSYAADFDDLFRRSARYVDKILKGTKPADLPVEQPTKFELVINLKTAKALGLTIPQPLLLRADQVIE
jgi:putative tryptophan/tyrosine transport system substrate-binding protein